MQLLVVGVGYVGAGLAGDLAAQGWAVAGLSRTEKPLPAGVLALQGDVTDPSSVRKLEREPEQIVLAISPNERSAAAYRHSYLNATRQLLKAFPRSRLVLVSSTAVYGESDGEVVDDNTPLAPPTDTARILADAESLALDAGGVVVRASGIYGPGRTRLLSQLVRGQVPAEDLSAWTNRIHQVDLRRVLAFLIERPDLQGSFLASDLAPARLTTMMRWAQEERRLLVRPASEGPTSSPTPARASPAAPTGRKSRRIVPSRLTAGGFTFRYPSFREGYAELLPHLTW